MFTHINTHTYLSMDVSSKNPRLSTGKYNRVHAWGRLTHGPITILKRKSSAVAAFVSRQQNTDSWDGGWVVIADSYSRATAAAVQCRRNCTVLSSEIFYLAYGEAKSGVNTEYRVVTSSD